MSVITNTRRRWTDATIESELRAQCADLGHFPTRSELVERGLRGLWDAMRTSSGADAWRERLQDRPAVTQDDIELLAYELYQRGAPGGPMDHWLAAERELG